MRFRFSAGAPVNCGGDNPGGRQPTTAGGGDDPAGTTVKGSAGGDAVLVVDDTDDGELYKYGPNQYGERDVIVPSRPPTASSTPESRLLTPAE